jgi:copper chaperone NosL
VKLQFLSIMMLMLIAGCSQRPADGPPVVRYGTDECADCGMILSDERFAAALRVMTNGESHDLLFDDIGDMLEYERANPTAHVSRRFVHDFDTRQWIDPAAAHFIKSEEFHSPMGSGIAAFADEQRGRARAEQSHSQLLAFGPLVEQERTTHVH